MYRGKQLAIILPAYNEETQIEKVIASLPDFADHIVIVDDASKDKTHEAVERAKRVNPKVVLLRHTKNQGVGGAMATGYVWARDNNVDIALRMDGDGQMDPADITSLLDPIVDEGVNYTKGNRLWHPDAFKIVPKIRYFGNATLSLLTKIASGYWHVSDSQTGFTAADKAVLQRINWPAMYKRYGQPNDLLVRLNTENFRVRDVPIRPVYNVGERSSMKISKVLFTISWLIFFGFVRRLWIKYVVRDFHPLVFFYSFAALQLLIFLGFLLRVILVWIADGYAPTMSSMACLFAFTIGVQSLFFAMLFDMEANKHLR